MSLLDVIRGGVKIADDVTKPLQGLVTYVRFLGSDAYGAPEFAAPVQLRAIIDYTSSQVRTPEGILTVSRASIMLLDINAVLAATADLGVDNNDRFFLPDGDTGPILDIRGFVDAIRGIPVATEIMIG
ncbi:MAG: hypothetical protein ACHQX3_00250 [Nitrospirales bacterium]